MRTDHSSPYKGGLPDRDSPWTETPQTETFPDRDPQIETSPGKRPPPPGQRPHPPGQRPHPPGQRSPWKKHGSKHRDCPYPRRNMGQGTETPLEGTWDQAARQEVISYKDIPPPPSVDRQTLLKKLSSFAGGNKETKYIFVREIYHFL